MIVRLYAVAWQAYGEWKLTTAFPSAEKAQKHIDTVLCTPERDYNKNAQVVAVDVVDRS